MRRASNGCRRSLQSVGLRNASVPWLGTWRARSSRSGFSTSSGRKERYYNIGLRDALRVCLGLLRPGGYLAFTDAIWRRENPPPAVKAVFDMDYPTMGWLDDGIAAIQDCGFELVGHFTLPDEAWWGDFYTPMETRITELRSKYAGDAEALAILDQLAEEPLMHRRYSDFYAYEFFVARRPIAPTRLAACCCHRQERSTQ